MIGVFSPFMQMQLLFLILDMFDKLLCFIWFLPGLTSQDQDNSMVSIPAVMSSISIGSRDESSPQKVEPQSDEYKKGASRKLALGKRDRSTILSPVSASSLRRSPRFKVSFC